MNNLHAIAIYTVTHYPERLILATIADIERKIIPIQQKYPTREWDIYMMYRVLREYDRLQQPTPTA